MQLENHSFANVYHRAYPLGRIEPSRSTPHNAEVQRRSGLGSTGACVSQGLPTGQSDTSRLRNLLFPGQAAGGKGGGTPVEGASDRSEQHRTCLGEVMLVLQLSLIQSWNSQGNPVYQGLPASIGRDTIFPGFPMRFVDKPTQRLQVGGPG